MEPPGDFLKACFLVAYRYPPLFSGLCGPRIFTFIPVLILLVLFTVVFVDLIIIVEVFGLLKLVTDAVYVENTSIKDDCCVGPTKMFLKGVSVTDLQRALLHLRRFQVLEIFQSIVRTRLTFQGMCLLLTSVANPRR